MLIKELGRDSSHLGCDSLHIELVLLLERQCHGVQQNDC